MSTFNPDKFHVTVNENSKTQISLLPRRYTLTHSDRTGDLCLTIAPDYDLEQISGWYTRLMRDEVLGEWMDGNPPSLHLHCQVSGRLVLGPAQWRAKIFRQHLPMVLEAICYGDRNWILHTASLQDAPILIHFHAKQALLDVTENHGTIQSYL